MEFIILQDSNFTGPGIKKQQEKRWKVHNPSTKTHVLKQLIKQIHI